MSPSRQANHVRNCASAGKTAAIEQDIHHGASSLEVYCSAIDLQFGQGTVACPAQDAGTLLAHLCARACYDDIRVERKNLGVAAIIDIPYVWRAVANHLNCAR